MAASATAVKIEPRDVAVAAALAIVAAGLTWIDAGTLCAGSEALYRSDDVWFESDTYRRFASMTSRVTDTPVTNQHPLFALFTYPATKLFVLLGARPLGAVQLVLALASATWIVALYTLLRLAGVGIVGAAVFSLLARTTATASFWAPVPEAFSLGAWSVLAPLVVLAIVRHRPLRDRWFVLAGVASVAYTVTNFMAAVVAALCARPWRSAVRILAVSLALAGALWCMQRLVMPSTVGLTDVLLTGGSFLYPPTGGPLVRLRALVVHSGVMPQVERLPRAWDQRPVLTVQHAALGSGSAIGIPVAVLWLVLLGFGAWSSWRSGPLGGLRRGLWLLIAGQLALHLVYGDEMFLYSLHLVPLLVIVAAMTSLTRYRWIGIGLAGVVTVGAWINNRAQLRHSAELVREYVIDPAAATDETQPR